MNRKRARIVVTGAVQGVGFRPFVYRLANELNLGGYVSNSAQGVLIEAEGADEHLATFFNRLEAEKPPFAQIQNLQCSFLAASSSDHFEIRSSVDNGPKTALILPDLTTCFDCLHELFDPGNRRYLYPFTNCTHCGPRFSIIETLPYDRANTSMKAFAMCPKCLSEYHDPADRRFHAQPNACPDCGPRLELWDAFGRCLSSEHDALVEAAAAVRDGRILALKGIGGFQLIADARNQATVEKLRLRKRREEKPFAVMSPSLEAARDCCDVTDLERQLLLSPASPIVLMKRVSGQSTCSITQPVAPQNPLLGVMLPYSPLHHLLMRELGFPVVATSGNLSGEPICISEHEALKRLRDVADIFLVHNRPIVRHMDDSVVRVMSGREMILRCARGYAPMPVSLRAPSRKEHWRPVLALGAHLKNAVAVSLEGQSIGGQHIGDLDNAEALFAFQKSARDLLNLYETDPEIIAHDLHPEYLSTKSAQQFVCADAEGNSAASRIAVQHHYAHILSCMAENNLSAPVLGVAWDGTGMGTDRTIWGGEFLLINETSFERFAHFREFRLPGGEAAIKQPRRCAVGLLYEIFGSNLFGRSDLPLPGEFSESELRMLGRMLEQGINSPVTSSAGRVFDAVASMVGLRQRATFEGQAAMELEFASAASVEGAYPFVLRQSAPLIFDWEAAVREILKEIKQGCPIGIIAAKFHNTLVELIVAVAKAAAESHVVLSGGCFQNQYLLEGAVRRLREEGFVPHWHSQVPPNDGGIALGQIVAVRRAIEAETRMGSKPDGLKRKVAPELSAAVDES